MPWNSREQTVWEGQVLSGGRRFARSNAPWCRSQVLSTSEVIEWKLKKNTGGNIVDPSSRWSPTYPSWACTRDLAKFYFALRVTNWYNCVCVRVCTPIVTINFTSLNERFSASGVGLSQQEWEASLTLLLSSSSLRAFVLLGWPRILQL